MAPNFSRLDTDRPEISRLLVAMLQARDALTRPLMGQSMRYPEAVFLCSTPVLAERKKQRVR